MLARSTRAGRWPVLLFSSFVGERSRSLSILVLVLLTLIKCVIRGLSPRDMVSEIHDQPGLAHPTRCRCGAYASCCAGRVGSRAPRGRIPGLLIFLRGRRA